MFRKPRKLRLSIQTVRQLTDQEAAKAVGASNPCTGTCEPGCSGNCVTPACTLNSCRGCPS